MFKNNMSKIAKPFSWMEYALRYNGDDAVAWIRNKVDKARRRREA